MNNEQYLKGIFLVIFTELVFCILEVKCRRIRDSDENNFGALDFQKLFQAMSRTNEKYLPSRNNRKFGAYKENELNHLLTVARDRETLQQWLRQDSNTEQKEKPKLSPKDELTSIIEHELLSALSKKTSAILDRPYLQKKGRNDFLVLRPDINDPFVTIIPNDIYYNVEKKCINWLDDCNQRGLRNRLLQRVNSPY